MKDLPVKNVPDKPKRQGGQKALVNPKQRVRAEASLEVTTAHCLHLPNEGVCWVWHSAFRDPGVMLAWHSPTFVPRCMEARSVPAHRRKPTSLYSTM